VYYSRQVQKWSAISVALSAALATKFLDHESEYLLPVGSSQALHFHLMTGVVSILWSPYTAAPLF
jgi:hypothetical protein